MWNKHSIQKLTYAGSKSIALMIWLAAGLRVLPAEAQDAAPALPLYVIGPTNRDNVTGFRDLCAQPDQWKAARAVTNELLCSDHRFSAFSDEDLKKWFAELQTWNTKLELEVGAVKDWGPTGAAAFKKEKPMWDRIQSMGGKISSIAMDEPLSCVRRFLKKPDDYAVEETANFIALVQQNYPDFKIIEIEPYPGIPLADHERWIDALQKKLVERNLKPLAAYRLDVDWLNFSMRDKGSWKEVKQLEDYCHAGKLPFSLIYWSAGYGYWVRHQMADDATWYVGVMSQGYAYASAGGKPDQYVMESWVGAPAATVPETGDFTFTRSALDFYNKFIKPLSPPAP
jgi:hypothetical protein